MGQKESNSVSYCGSRAGSHTRPQLQQCSGSPGRWVSHHSMSEALPGGIGPSSSPASGSGAKESPRSHACGFRASHHLPPTVRCSCSAPPWPGSCHTLCVTGRSSSTSPASSLPATGENHFISSPRSIRDHVLQCLLAPLHLSVPSVPTTSHPNTAPLHHSKRPPVPSELFRRDLGNPFDTNSILRYK